jgi:phospholipase/carboxylesterase
VRASDPGAIAATGLATANARAVIIMPHGRGATADDILSLSDEIALDDVAYLAPLLR